MEMLVLSLSESCQVLDMPNLLVPIFSSSANLINDEFMEV